MIEACRSVANQSFKDFELCISDDCSTDERSDELCRYLDGSGMRYVYARTERNLRYDGNLRSAIGLATGRYCFLLGNDDALASVTVLEELHDAILRLEPPGVVITNYEDQATGSVTRRIKHSHVVGSGPRVAAGCFRNFGFVSGVVFETAAARTFASEAWDGSEYYQMFLGCRIIASGKPLVDLDMVTVRKDIQIPDECVDSYKLKSIPNSDRIVERPTNLVTIGPLVVDAIRPFLSENALEKIASRIFLQILLFTYGFWIFEFRRVHSWKYAAGFCLAMRPRRILANVKVGFSQRVFLELVHGAVSIAGLFAPLVWFERLYPSLHRLAKSALRIPGRSAVARVGS